jgi:hypothetical protein
LDDSDSQKTLSEISKRAATYFDTKNKWPERTAALDELNAMKKPIEAELGGQLAFDHDGTVRLKMPNGSSSTLFSPDATPQAEVVVAAEETGQQPKSMTSQLKVENSGQGNIESRATAFMKGYDGKENINQEVFDKLDPAGKRAMEATSRNLSVMADNLAKVPVDSPQAETIRKTMKAIISSAEKQFGQGAFSGDIKSLIEGGHESSLAAGPVVENGAIVESATASSGNKELFNAMKFEVLDKDPMAAFPQDKLSFADNFPAADRAKFEAYFQSSLAERNEMIKQLSGWKEKYGNRPQYAAFEELAVKAINRENSVLERVAKAAAGQGKIEVSIVGNIDPSHVADMQLENMASTAKLWSPEESSEDAFSELEDAINKKKAVAGSAAMASNTPKPSFEEPVPKTTPEKEIDFAQALEDEPKPPAAASTEFERDQAGDKQIITSSSEAGSRPEPQNFRPLENTLFKGGRGAASEAVESGSVREGITMTLAEAKNFDQPLLDPKLAESLAGQGAYINLRNVPSVSNEVLKVWSGQNKTFNLLGLNPEELNDEACELIRNFKGSLLLSDEVLKKVGLSS